jgi:DNA-binding GntR family transcriptional regulator
MINEPSGVIKHRTLDGYVVEEIRSRIVSGDLPAGTRIDQQALSEELGISRMPVREALRRLAAEGFVELISHRGALVTKLSDAEIIEIYEMRAVLQGLAARLAVPNFTDQHLEALPDLLEKMETTTELGTWVDLNRTFHDVIELPCGAQRLLSLIERLAQQCAPYVQIALHYLEARKSTAQEHREIYDACLARDADVLEHAVRRHLSAWGRHVARYVQPAGRKGTDDHAATPI